MTALRVLQVSTALHGGGAEAVAAGLHHGLLRHGHDARLVVGSAGGSEPGVMSIPEAGLSGAEGGLRSASARALTLFAPRPRALERLSRALVEPGSMRRWIDRQRGREAFDFPGTQELLHALPWTPDVVHCHNLHSLAFDLRYLSVLSSTAPLMLTLHDEWLFTGHCAYTLGCERWRSGCGSCPHLDAYPALKRDGSAANRAAKESIYDRSSFFVSAPSNWLIERAKESILAEGAVDFRVIRNGVDPKIYHDQGREAARQRLGIADAALVLFFAANRARSSPYKDHQTVIEAARQVASALPDREVVLLCLGERGPVERHVNSELRFLGYESDPATVADHYRAADLYLHAANADNAPLTVLEALSCGTPVIATAVGGIPEQVRSLAGVPGAIGDSHESVAEATGVLVPASDPASMASAAVHLVGDRRLLAQLSANAVADSIAKSTIEKQISTTLSWYREAVGEWQSRGVQQS